MGALFTEEQFPSGTVPTMIESILSVQTGKLGLTGHYTTYECAVHGFGSVRELAKIRKQGTKTKVVVPGQRIPRYA